MHPHGQDNPFAATAPAQPPVAPPRRPRLDERQKLAIAAGGLGVFVLMVGIAIGRCSKTTMTVVTGAATATARVTVSAKPIEANVVLDGRFVGVTPIERIDLEPGKHSVVVDAFGYQPYASTLDVDPKAKMTLRVLLAPMGGSGSTSGETGGSGGKTTVIVVPPTALLPAGGIGGGGGGSGSGSGSSSAATKKSAPPRTYAPPPRPRRDCWGERSTCENNCRSAQTSCDFGCPGCSSCNTSTGWDECNRQCASCKQGCKSNVTFCESSCQSNYSSCNDSNN